MDSESQRIYDRMRLHQLILTHPNSSSRQLAALMARSERWVRKWVQRFKTVEMPSFSMFVSQSRAPKRRPRQISDTVKEAICELRETLSEQYHRAAGATLIRRYLLEDTTLQQTQERLPTSSRTVTRILRERGYIQSLAKREHMPLERCDPMEEWEMDFCEVRLLEGRFEFFLVVDRGTSRVVYLEGSVGYRADTAIMAVFRLFLHHGLPKRLRFDRDPRFVWSWSADSYPAPLLRLLRVLGVEPVICPPRRPDKKPYVERCVRTFKHEWLDRFSLETIVDCYEALATFPHYHNHQRIHLGRACQGRTPDEAFPNLPVLPALPERVNPNHWLMSQHGRVFRRHVRANGTIQVDKHVYYVDGKWAKRRVLVHVDAHQRCLRLTADGKHLPKVLPLKGLHDEQLDLQRYLSLLQDEARSIAHYRQIAWMKSGDVA